MIWIVKLLIELFREMMIIMLYLTVGEWGKVLCELAFLFPIALLMTKV